MGKKVLTLNRCETCGFSTKNYYIFKRHKNRCDKKIYAPVNPLPTTSTDISDVPEGGDNSALPLPPPLVNRNYRCTECGFTTNKSKIFLNHSIDNHGAKFSVYECSFCEYASRWKHKLDRHVKYAHKKFSLVHEELQADAVGVKQETESGDGETAEPSFEGQMQQMPFSKLLNRGFPRISFKTSKRSRLIAAKKSHVLSGFKAKTVMQKVPAYQVQAVMGADGETKYKCKLCLYSSNKKKQTVKHITACHVNAMFFKCSKCDFTTDKRIEFYTHKISHSNASSEEVYTCEECSYSTYIKKNLDCHREKHGSDNPFKCSVCSYATGHEAALKRHVTNHHQNSVQNESLVLGHTSSSDPSGAPMETDLPENIQEESMNVDETETNSSVEEGKNMTCPICGLSFGRPADLGKHVIARHNVRLNEIRQMYDGASLEEPTTSGSIPRKTITFKPKKIGLGKDKMKCTFCSYTTKWPSDYRRHIAVHSVERRYKCPLCMKKYKYLSDVNVHVRRDHKCEPSGIYVQEIAMVPNKKSSPALFRCPACPFITKTKIEMDKHSSTHNKEDKTFQCKHCDYQTYWRGDIGRHLYKHHGDLLPNDKMEVDLKEFMIIRPERIAFKRKPKAVRLSEMEGFNPDACSLESVSCEPALDDTSDSMSTTSSQTATKKEPSYMGPVKCDHCPFTTNTTSKLKAHIATHFNLKRFKCPICGRRSNWKWDMRKHLKREHPEITRDVITLSVEEAKRSIGEYLETQPNIRREHHFNVWFDNTLSSESQKKMKKPFQCSLCKFRSDFRWSVSKHLRTIHPREAGSIVLLTDVDSSIVTDSSQIPTLETPTKSTPSTPNESPSSLDKHHHLRAPSVKNTFRQPVPSGDVNMDRPFMCPECGKRCTTKGDVKKHYHYAHPNLEVKVIYVPDGTEFLYTSNFTIPNTPPKSESRKRHNDIQTIKASSPVKGKESFEGSKFSNPKLHGYVKPFKCSVCHHRSNWKWDLKKHLRERHPNSCGYIILMDINEAKDTYAEECKITERTNLTVNKPKVSPVTSGPDEPPTEYLPFNMTQDTSRCRRFKCSACSYRSNWRTDLLRHLKRKHSLAKTKVVLLNEEFARSTLSQYRYVRNSRDPFANKEMNQKRIASGLSGMPHSLAIDEKIWRCPRCAFEATFRSHIIKHMQKHGMKPFQCRICDFCSNFRTNLHRHVSKLHGKSDCKPFIKVCIKYSNSVNSSMSEENTATVTGVPEKATVTVISEQYIDVFLCRKCNLQFSSALLCHRHLREFHGCDDKTQCMKFRKRQRVKVPEGEQYVLNTESEGQAAGFDRKKNYMCTLCPYTANKRGLLNFHMTYHKPQPFNKYKCKHCPYYVSRPRLLQQHVRLHTLKLAWEKTQITPQNSPAKNVATVPVIVTHTTPKKHLCEKCPYSTNSKNDILYHRQFHRPKPSAEFKCDHCDYWVTHRRLLKQHVKCHTAAAALIASPVQTVQCSPIKSEVSENSAVLDTIEIAAWKQQFICSKITASLSTNPTCSPTKLAAQCSMGYRPGYIIKNGIYRKLHSCRSCPYMNIRARNLRLHEMMHGKRPSKHPLLKCPDCDYYVGARGLLAHHMKVHQPSYVQDFNDSIATQMGKTDGQQWEEEASDPGEINPQHKVDTLLEIVRFKKYCCEKCPYASAKRNHFQRHVELHGSRQRFTCDFCDYSVPSKNLLAQHRKLHLMPNQNLLTIQSLSNLQYLTEVPADVALASALPAVDDKKPVTISVTHDHLELYENIPESELEPKKLYRCDRCPYANVQRDHLLTHLKFHVMRSQIACPYCDYSVPTQHLLTQHIRVHFCPLPELSEWLTQNGQTDRIPKDEQLDLSEALEVARKCQNTAAVVGGGVMKNGAGEQGVSGTATCKLSKASLKKIKSEPGTSAENLPEENSAKSTFSSGEVTAGQDCIQMESGDGEPQDFGDESKDVGDESQDVGDESKDVDVKSQNVEGGSQDVGGGSQDVEGGSQDDDDIAMRDDAGALQDGESVPLDEVFVCQYCDREIVTSERLLRHEMQHLIGNHYEVSGIAAQKTKVNKLPIKDDLTEDTPGNGACDVNTKTESSAAQSEESTTHKDNVQECTTDAAMGVAKADTGGHDDVANGSVDSSK